MTAELNILFVEDLATDVELAKRALTKEGLVFKSRVVETEDDFLRVLESDLPDLIICDYKMPRFNGMYALTLRLEKYPDVPFILLTSSINEEVAVECMKNGADDYVLKDNLNRLVPAIRSALVKKTVKREKQEALNKLQESEERFRSLYENSTIGLYRTTPDGKIILANPTLVRMLGYLSFKELASRDLDKDGFEPNYERRLFIEHMEMDGEVKGFESAWTRKDGTIVYVRESAKVLRDSNGKTLYYDGSVEDITERKRAEEALRESQLFIEGIIDAIPVRVFWKDKNLVFMGCNSMFARDAGFTNSKEIIGKDDYQMVWKDEAELYRADDRMVIESGESKILFEESQTTPEGKKITLLTSKLPLRNLRGECIGILGTYIDITELELAQEEIIEREERWRSLVSNSPDYIALTDKDGKYLFLNRYAEGFTEDQVIGKSIFDYISEESKEIFLRKFNECIRTWENQNFEYSAYGDNGVLRIYEQTYVPMLNRRKEINLLLIARDITERKKAEEALQESEAKLKVILESTADGILAIDINGKVIKANTRFIELWHIPSTVISSGNDNDLLNFVLDQLNDPEQFLNKVKLLYKSTDEDFDTIIFKDGRIFERYSVPLLMNDKVLGRVWSFRDITKRKRIETELIESEFLLSQSQRLAHIGSWSWDFEGPFKWSYETYNIYGVTKETFIPNPESLINLIHPEDREAMKLWLESRSPEQSKHYLDFRIILPDGSVRFINGTGNIVFDTKNKPSYKAGTVQDITERKLAEQKIKENEEIFTQLLANSPVYIFFKDENKHAIRLSKNYEKMLNRPLNEILNKNMYELFPPDIAKEMMEDDKKILNAGELVKVDEKINGRYYHTIKFPINIEGKPRYLAGFTLDITDRLMIEEALHESNEFLERLFNYATAPIVVWNDKFIITRFNSAFEALIGKTAKEVISKPIEILFPPEKIESSMKLITQAQSGEDLENEEMDILYSDGSVRTVLWNSASVPGLEEKSLATIAQGLDITERLKMEAALRKSKKEFQTYFDSNTIGLSVTSPDKSWIEVNQKLCEMLGFTKAELIEYDWLELTHPEDITYDLKLFNQALDGEIDNYQLDKRFLRKDGSIIYVAMSAVCLRNDDGSVHHFLTSYNDITHRKLAEAVILESEEKLRALNTRLETIKEEERINLSRELHDHLGQNLTGLKMEISYFSKKMKNQEAFNTQDFLSKANDMMELIDDMINNVRKISAELRPNVLDYLGLIPAIEWQLEELKKRTEIETELKSNVVKIDLGDHINSSIFRIVQEAFTNIMRHAGATKVIVSTEESDDKIRLEILDNGKGINEKEILNVKSLGIIGMKERTLQFNGTLDFKNVPLGGTLLTLIIPKSGELND